MAAASQERRARNDRYRLKLRPPNSGQPTRHKLSLLDPQEVRELGGVRVFPIDWSFIRGPS
jgi:hypothetical protein